MAAAELRADMVPYSLDREFSGATPPSGSAPWLTATFASTTPGTVTLTLENLLNGSTEFVSGWYFNFDPALSLLGLNVSQAVGGPTATVSQGTDAFKADGDGYFDIQLQWGANLFTNASPPLQFEFTSAEAITAGSFAFLSTGAGNSPDGLFTAAHVQGIGNGDSGWITGPETGSVVPAPQSMVLGLLGLGTVLWCCRRS